MRIEPSSHLRNFADFFTFVAFPATVQVWHVPSETRSRHCNPLFDRTLGISPFRVLNADMLHCLFLGVLNAFVHAMIWAMMTSGHWGHTVQNQDEQIKTGIILFRQRLMAWYRSRRQAGEVLTEVGDITKKKNMIGDPTDRKVGFKSAECWHVLRFLLDELHAHRVQPRYVLAGRCLAQLLAVWSKAGWRLTPSEVSQSWHCFLRIFGIHGE